MWPFSETNAAAMRTLKTPVYAESSAQSGEEHLPAWKRETKDQHGVSTSSRLARSSCLTRNFGVPEDRQALSGPSSKCGARLAEFGLPAAKNSGSPAASHAPLIRSHAAVLELQGTGGTNGFRQRLFVDNY